MYIFFSNLKNYTSPANKFLIHVCRQTDNQTHIYLPSDKRYSPIISTIYGLNKRKRVEEHEPNHRAIFDIF